jgi:hypothetical protein
VAPPMTPDPADVNTFDPPPRPSVGRIVHYVSYGTPPRADGSQEFPTACRAAIVTEVDEEATDLVGLAVFNPTGMYFLPIAAGGCAHDEGQQYSGTWHFPERV